MLSVENGERAALSRLSEALERRGIKIQEGSWLKEVLDNSVLEVEAYKKLQNWLENVEKDKREGKKLNPGEYLSQLQEHLQPLLEGFLLEPRPR